MNLKNHLTKSKNGIAKKFASISTVITILTTLAMTQINAAIDFAEGVEQVANEVTSQGKTIFGIVFGAVAVFALGFTVFKGVKAGFAYRRGENVELGPVIGGAVATLVCGLGSAGAIFFGWFGL